MFEYCPECQVEPGALHHEGCDVEPCALCGGQRISCNCIFTISGMDPKSTLDITDEMAQAFLDEEDKYGGRLPWEGEWPGESACREFRLYCYWGSRDTKAPMRFPQKGGSWIPCSPDTKGADYDLNRIKFVANWDKEQRRYVPKAN